MEEAVDIQAAGLAERIDQNILRQALEGAAVPRARRLDPFADYGPRIGREDDY